MEIIILISTIILISGITALVVIRRQKTRRNAATDASKERQYSPTVTEAHQKILQEFQLLEKMDGNVEKEKAEPLMKFGSH